jgi:hypothetical protein
MESEEEIWKTIEDYSNYAVSNLGRVKNINRQYILKQSNRGGYSSVSLKNSNCKKNFRVHRLVANAFIPNIENKSDVNHKDKNRSNNNINNLEWMTRKENNQHKSIDLVYKNNRNKTILRINKNNNDILEKYSSIELAGIWALNNKLTKTSHNGRNAIGNCLIGLSKTAYGYKWKYENNYEDLENEIWKEVIIKINNTTILNDDDKKYFVSNLGRFKDSQGIIKEKYKVNGFGYQRVFIFNKTYLIHRLIAFTFLDNPDNKEQVNHIDGNKLNNKVENLEWVTNKENQIHKFQCGLGNNFTRKIIQYDLEMNEINKFNSISGASKILKIGKSNIQGVLLKKRKTAGGFIFKYLDE